jgi:hypothetical protein
MSNPFRYFNSSPEVIRLVVMMYVRYPLSLRNVEDLLPERGIDISYETVRFWWNRFGPMFAAEIRKKRVEHMRGGRYRSDSWRHRRRRHAPCARPSTGLPDRIERRTSVSQATLPQKPHHPKSQDIRARREPRCP